MVRFHRCPHFKLLRELKMLRLNRQEVLQLQQSVSTIGNLQTSSRIMPTTLLETAFPGEKRLQTGVLIAEVFGSTGKGKTHMLNGLKEAIKEKIPEARVKILYEGESDEYFGSIRDDRSLSVHMRNWAHNLSKRHALERVLKEINSPENQPLPIPSLYVLGRSVNDAIIHDWWTTALLTREYGFQYEGVKINKSPYPDGDGYFDFMDLAFPSAKTHKNILSAHLIGAPHIDVSVFHWASYSSTENLRKQWGRPWPTIYYNSETWPDYEAAYRRWVDCVYPWLSDKYETGLCFIGEEGTQDEQEKRAHNYFIDMLLKSMELQKTV